NRGRPRRSDGRDAAHRGWPDRRRTGTAVPALARSRLPGRGAHRDRLRQRRDGRGDRALPVRGPRPGRTGIQVAGSGGHDPGKRAARGMREWTEIGITRDTRVRKPVRGAAAAGPRTNLIGSQRRRALSSATVEPNTLMPDNWLELNRANWD